MTARDPVPHAVPQGAHHDPGDDHPLVLSYVDVVVQGFLAEYGIAGVGHFFATTTGWPAASGAVG